MENLYYLHKKSGKLRRMYKNACVALGIDPYTIPRTVGSRFTAHRLRGVRTILHGWIPFANSLREALNDKVKMAPGTQGKVTGYLKKLHSFSFLKTVQLYKELLQAPAAISLCFEREEVLVWTVEPVVEKAKEKLNDLLEQDDVETSAGCYSLYADDNSSTGYSLRGEIIKLGHNHRKKNKDTVSTVTLDLADIKDTTNAGISNIKQKVIPSMKTEIDKRFGSFSEAIYCQMSRIMDTRDWITSDKNFKSMGRKI